MHRDQVLATAAAFVTDDRAETHGKLEDNFATVAAYWSAYLASVGVSVDLRRHDVAAMMVLFKVARAGPNPVHANNWIDMAGYAACGAEVAGAVEK